MTKIKKGEINEETYLNLLNKVIENKEEERAIAMNTYKKIETNIMENIDFFVVAGKNAATYLSIVSDCTNKLADIAKEIKTIVFKEDLDNTALEGTISEEFKRNVNKIIEEK